MEAGTPVECHWNNAKVSNFESRALDRSAIPAAFEEAGDCLFLAMNFTSCQENYKIKQEFPVG